MPTLEQQEKTARREMRKRRGASHRKAAQQGIISPANPDKWIPVVLTDIGEDAAPNITLIIRLKQCNAEGRREYRRRIARSGVQCRTVQTTEDYVGNSIPLALEITGREADVKSAALDHAVLSYSHPLDVPTFISGAGQCSMDGASASARREMKRRTMRKSERRAREERETTDYRREVAQIPEPLPPESPESRAISREKAEQFGRLESERQRITSDIIRQREERAAEQCRAGYDLSERKDLEIPQA